MFPRAVVRGDLQAVPRKRQPTLRLDDDVLEWFRRKGPGYQTRIDALLRAYLEESRKAHRLKKDGEGASRFAASRSRLTQPRRACQGEIRRAPGSRC